MNSSSQSPWVIETYRSPWRQHAVWAVGLIVVVAMGIGGYYWGYERAYEKYASSVAAEQRLLTVRDDLVQQQVLLKEDVARLEVALRVDQAAIEQVRQENLSLVQDMSALEQQLSFYKGLMEPSEAKKGLTIEQWQVLKATDSEKLRFRLLLTQIADKHNTLQGSISITLNGLEQNQEKDVNLKEFLINDDQNLAFQFKYFQTIEGEFALPENFNAESIKVDVKTSGRKAQERSKTFPWSIEEASYVGQ